MASLPLNIERSGFRPGEYVGHDCTARPGFWRIRRRAAGGWVALHGLNASAGFIFGRTLGDLGASLNDANRINRAFAL